MARQASATRGPRMPVSRVGLLAPHVLRRPEYPQISFDDCPPAWCISAHREGRLSMTKRLILSALMATVAVPARAQTPDHLKCYRVKDPTTRTTYTANLDGRVPENG